jgi:KDO2-lipid IV(A) lauroyltransferase
MARKEGRWQFFIFKTVKALIPFFPRKICLFAGKTIGLIFYHLDKKHRLIALSNLKTAFGPELEDSALRRIARNSFAHFGQFIMDCVKFPSLTEKQKDALIHVEGEENLEKALQEKKGILLFSAHYGNWEVSPHFLKKKGRLNVIARALDNELLERELLELRTALGARVIYKQRATKQVLQALRANEIVAFLIDQNVLRQQAVFVDFFGKKAATTPSLAAFFLKTNSPLVPGFCYPTPSSAYKIIIHSPLKFAPGESYEEQVLKITQTCTNIIEAQIRQNPDYWLWFHKRWRTRPKGERSD